MPTCATNPTLPRCILVLVATLALPLVAQNPQDADDDPLANRQYFVQRRTTTGTVSTSAYDAALEQIQGMEQYSTRAQLTQGPIPNGTSLPSALGWDWLGPNNVGGRTRALIVHPGFAVTGNQQTVYAAGADGGVWRSNTNSGTRQWEPLDSGSLTNLAVNSLALAADPAHLNDPVTYDILYAGTGEGYFNDDAVRGNGIYKWTASTGWRGLANTRSQDFYYVNKLVVSPLNPSRLYAGTRTGVFRSSDQGENWTQILGTTLPGGVMDLVIRDHDTLGNSADYLIATAGTHTPNSLYGAPPAQVLVLPHGETAPASTTMTNWQSTYPAAGSPDPGLGRTSLAIAPSNPDRIYALSAEASTATHYENGLHAVLMSIDAGQSWVTQVSNAQFTSKVDTLLLSDWTSGCDQNAPLRAHNFGWRNNVIAVDPTSQAIVWAGGMDLAKSTDYGRTWSRASAWEVPDGAPAGAYMHADQHAIEFALLTVNPTTYAMFVGNDGGVYQATNRTADGDSRCPDDMISGYPNILLGWTAVNTGYGVTQFYHGLPFPSSTATCIGGTQDNGTLKTDIDLQWKDPHKPPVEDYDAGFIAIDGTTTPPALYGETLSTNQINLSLDGGLTWTTQSPSALNGLFVTPIAQDPGYGQRTWAGGSALWRRESSQLVLVGDQGWTQASKAFTNSAAVSAIAVSPNKPDHVLVGLNDGRIGFSENATMATYQTDWHPQLVEPGFASFCSSIAFDPNDRDGHTAYATFSAFNVANVWKTTDAFAQLGVAPTWQRNSGSGLPQVPAHWIIPDNTQVSRLLVGTDIGVFTSTDGGAHWMQEITGFPPTSVDSMAENVVNSSDAAIYAFTHGRGAFKVPIKYIAGDANADGVADVSDVFYMINALFNGGPWAAIKPADVNGDRYFTVADVFYLINFLFAHGPAPYEGGTSPGGQSPAGLNPLASDSIAIGNISVQATAQSALVPVYVNDALATTLGSDQATGYDITEFIFEVTHASPCISGASFDRSTGILAGLEPIQGAEFSGTVPGSSFHYGVDLQGPVPFTHGPIGDKIGDLLLTLNACPVGVVPLAVSADGPWGATLGCLQCNVTNYEQASHASPDGLQITNGQLILLGATPTVTSVAPTIGPTGGGATVTIYGTNFLSAATVAFGGVAATVTSVQSDHIVVTTPPHAWGTVTVTVTNPDLQTASATNGYVFDNAPSAALVATPSSGVAPLAVTLSAAGSSDLDSAAGDSVASYQFTPGDGLNPTTQASAAFSYTYASAGTYTASVAAVDTKGLASSPATTTVAVAVPVDNAQFVSQDVPSTMVRNHAYTLTFRIKNTGNTTWHYYTYFLESQNPKDNTIFGAAQLGSCDQEPPGVTCTWTVNVTAPSTTGTYNIQRRMLHNGVNFGDYTPNVVVTVTNH